MSVTLGSPPGGFNSFLIHCPISKQYLCQLHWDLHPEGVNRFWIHCTNFLTVFVLLPCLCDLHQKALTEFWLASPQNPMRKGRLDNFHALHTNPPRWPPQRHELLPVCVPGATFRHISGPRKGTALTHEKCTRFRGPSRYYDLSPLFVNFYALGFTCSWHNHAHTMSLHALAKAPSPTQALKIKMYRGQIKPEFFLQEPPDKRMTRIGMGGPKTRAIFEEVL